MSLKKIKVLILVIALAVVGSGLIIFANKSQYDLPAPTAEEQKTATEQAVLVIDDGQGNPKTFNVEFNQGNTVFALLRAEAEKSGLDLKIKIYDIGVLVEGIGGVENGENGKYWLYYVNGEMPMVSADKNQVKPGDKIEFKYARQ